MAIGENESNTTLESCQQQTEPTSIEQDHPHLPHQRQSVLVCTQTAIAASTATVFASYSSSLEENIEGDSTPVDLTIKKLVEYY